jgi:hypothetical protein
MNTNDAVCQHRAWTRNSMQILKFCTLSFSPTYPSFLHMCPLLPIYFFQNEFLPRLASLVSRRTASNPPSEKAKLQYSAATTSISSLRFDSTPTSRPPSFWTKSFFLARSDSFLSFFTHFKLTPNLRYHGGKGENKLLVSMFYSPSEDRNEGRFLQESELQLVGCVWVWRCSDS